MKIYIIQDSMGMVESVLSDGMQVDVEIIDPRGQYNARDRIAELNAQKAEGELDECL